MGAFSESKLFEEVVSPGKKTMDAACVFVATFMRSARDRWDRETAEGSVYD